MYWSFPHIQGYLTTSKIGNHRNKCQGRQTQSSVALWVVKRSWQATCTFWEPIKLHFSPSQMPRCQIFAPAVIPLERLQLCMFDRRLRRNIIGVFRPHYHAFFSRVPQLWCFLRRQRWFKSALNVGRMETPRTWDRERLQSIKGGKNINATWSTR